MSDRGARPAGPGVVYGTLTVGLVIVLAVVSLTVASPPPPTVAEFAPQAVDQIEEAPLEQLSDFGEGRGDGGDATDEASPPDRLADAVDVIDVPRVRRCVGDPPRQIEDPQSPPCIPYWEGENGGSTYKGVLRDEIRIAAPGMDGNHTILEQFFNRRFELYGRRLRFVPIDQRSEGTPEEERARAVEADSENVFASLHYFWGSTYYEELARRGVLSAVDTPFFFQEVLTRTQPYVWQYPMAVDRIMANMGEWACGRFAGSPAEHAGDPTLQDQQRVFGAFFDYWTWERQPDTLAALESELARCGERLELAFVTDGQTIESRDADPQRSNEMLQMKAAGVTTIFCLCHRLGRMRAATAQTYYPEWLLTTYSWNDKNSGLRTGPSDQVANSVGITVQPRQVRSEDMPVRWAMREIDPTWDGDVENVSELVYRPLLALASGLQMAGPNLTPETFQRGLHQTRFPNPDHPIMAGAVGFGARDHSMTIDAAEYWWSDTAPSPFDGTRGSICYVDGGLRHQKGSWPTGPDAFFRQPCDSGG